MYKSVSFFCFERLKCWCRGLIMRSLIWKMFTLKILHKEKAGLGGSLKFRGECFLGLKSRRTKDQMKGRESGMDALLILRCTSASQPYHALPRWKLKNGGHYWDDETFSNQRTHLSKKCHWKINFSHFLFNELSIFALFCPPHSVIFCFCPAPPHDIYKQIGQGPPPSFGQNPKEQQLFSWNRP